MILVTGGAGYIGSHMVLRLLDNGNDVVIFDNLETGHIETIELLKNIKSKGRLQGFIKGDLRNKADIDSLFNEFKIDSVIHFAAVALVGESVINPQKYWHNNVMGTINLLDSMIEHNVNRIVFSSTAATYGEPKYTPIDENHPQLPINPYGQSKLTVEKIMDDYDKAYGLRSVRLRYFNVAGADSKLRVGEWHDIETHLIPNIIKSTLGNDKTFEIFGNTYNTKDGTCVRDYVNVEDLTNAHILALDYLKNGGKTDFFNLGTKEGNSVKEVFEYSEKVLNRKISVKISEKREGDPATLIADNKKASEILGWKPEKTLSDSIKTAYEWEIKRSKLYK